MEAVAQRSTYKSICEALLREIEEFLSFTAIKPETFGRLTVNDPNLCFKLSRHGEIKDEAVNRIRLFMQNYEEARA